MKIGIDVSQVVYGTGVSKYTEKLVSELLRLDKNNQYVLYGGSLRRIRKLSAYFDSLVALKGAKFERKIYPIPPMLTNILFNSLRFPGIESFTGKLDVFHSSDWSQPKSSAYKVTTVHDLSFLKLPKLTHPKIVKVQTKRLELVKEEVDKIIVPSKTIRKDLIEIGFKEAKIEVIYEANNYEPAEKEVVKDILAKHGISKKFLLTVGVNPRKNTKRIIKAFKSLRMKGTELVLVGHPSHIKVKSTSGVKLLGHVSDKDLAGLYTEASVLVYPSLYEGFGQPILEAFNCKTPVVTSNSGSMSEIAADAAVLVNPKSANSIAEGIKKAVKNSEKLVKTGINRAKNFSWSKAAKETLKIYESAKT